MKKTITVAIIILLAQFCFGQLSDSNYEIKKGEPVKFKGMVSMFNTFTDYEQNFYVYRIGVGMQVDLFKYDKNLDNKKEINVELKYKDNDTYFQAFFPLKKSVYLLSSFVNKKLGKQFLFAQSISSGDNPIVNNDIKKIAEVEHKPNILSGAFRNPQMFQTFKFVTSKDSSKVMILYQYPHNSYDDNKYEFIVYDDSFNELWKKQLLLPKDKDFFTVKDFKVSNDGKSAYLIGLESKNKLVDIDKTKRPPEYKYKILGFNAGNDEQHEFYVEIENQNIINLNSYINNDVLLCSGYYAPNEIFNIKGVFAFTINLNTRKMSDISKLNCDINALLQGYPYNAEKIAEKSEKGNRKDKLLFDIDKVRYTEDGGMLLFGSNSSYSQITTTRTNYPGEKNIGTSVGNRSSSGASGTTKTTYSCKNIMCTYITPDGTVKNTYVIPNYQNTSSPYSIMYNAIVKKDVAYIIRNDSFKNFEYKSGDKLKRFKGDVSQPVVVVDKISYKTGDVKKELLFEQDKRNKIYIQAPLSANINYGDIFYTLTKEKKSKKSVVPMKVSIK